MIKNILYSLLLHSTFAFLIYFNFHHTIQENIDLKDGVVVSIASLQDFTKSEKIIAKTEKEETKPQPKKEKTIIKKNSKPKIKNTKPIAKPVFDQKTEFKKLEETKTEETEKKPTEEKPEEIIKKNETETKNKEETTQESKEKEQSEEQSVNNTENISDAQNLENLQLSAREKFNIQSQLRACYKRALINTPKSNYTALIKVTILQDGTIDFDPDEIIDVKKYTKDANYKNRMDSVIQTLELCSPLRNMPFDKYEIWREFTIEFGDDQ